MKRILFSIVCIFLLLSAYAKASGFTATTPAEIPVAGQTHTNPVSLTDTQPENKDSLKAYPTQYSATDDKRIPVPESISEENHSEYDSRIIEASMAEGGTVAAKTLLRMGEEQKDNPELRFLFFRTAGTRGVGDDEVFKMAVRKLTDDFQLETMEAELIIIRQLEKWELGPFQQKVTDIVNRAIATHDLDLAVSAIRILSLWTVGDTAERVKTAKREIEDLTIQELSNSTSTSVLAYKQAAQNGSLNGLFQFANQYPRSWLSYKAFDEILARIRKRFPENTYSLSPSYEVEIRDVGLWKIKPFVVALIPKEVENLTNMLSMYSWKVHFIDIGGVGDTIDMHGYTHRDSDGKTWRSQSSGTLKPPIVVPPFGEAEYVQRMDMFSEWSNVRQVFNGNNYNYSGSTRLVRVPIKAMDKAVAKESEPTAVASHGTQLTKPSEDKNAQLPQAAKDGKLQDVQALLSNGADVNTRDKDGVPVLILATNNGHTQVVNLLLEKDADVNAKTITDGVIAFWIASQKGYMEIFNLLLEKGADVNVKTTDDSTTALYVASENGHIEVVKLLLQKGVEVNVKRTTNGVTALWIASQNGHAEVIKLLLDKGADVNVKDSLGGSTALLQASQNGHIEIVKLLFEKGADINVSQTKTGCNALFLASQNGYNKVVSFLIENGANVNAKETVTGCSALWQASWKGHTDVVKLLLEKDADVNVKRTTDGVTALLIAAREGHSGVVKLLLDKGADVNAKAGMTALWIASQNGYTEIVRLLLSAKADVNTTNTKNGTTPLLVATANARTDIVRLLLDAKADLNVKIILKGKNYMALSMAKEMGNTEIVKLLEKAGAKE